MTLATASVCNPSRRSAATAGLLGKLAFDDAFRARLEASPHEVLGEYGFAVAPASGLDAVTLPTKEAAGAALAAAARRGTINCDGGPIIFVYSC